MRLAILDTGCANLASVAFAFERLGIAPDISFDPNDIRTADKVVLPGVGSARFAMQNLEARGLVPVIKSLKQPVLGICLGMQLLFKTSKEGETDMLGLIDAEITPLDTGDFPAPHMGWNTIAPLSNDPLLKGVSTKTSDADHVYFVHSYAAPLGDYSLARTDYGEGFSAVVRQDNFYGCQFHPERSAKTGAKILQNFLELDR